MLAHPRLFYCYADWLRPLRLPLWRGLRLRHTGGDERRQGQPARRRLRSPSRIKRRAEEVLAFANSVEAVMNSPWTLCLSVVSSATRLSSSVRACRFSRYVRHVSGGRTGDIAICLSCGHRTVMASPAACCSTRANRSAVNRSCAPSSLFLAEPSSASVVAYSWLPTCRVDMSDVNRSTSDRNCVTSAVRPCNTHRRVSTPRRASTYLATVSCCNCKELCAGKTDCSSGHTSAIALSMVDVLLCSCRFSTRLASAASSSFAREDTRLSCAINPILYDSSTGARVRMQRWVALSRATYVPIPPIVSSRSSITSSQEMLVL